MTTARLEKSLVAFSDWRKIVVHYNATQKSLAEEVSRHAVAADRELKSFFNSTSKEDYHIYLAESRKDFDRLSGYPFDWEKLWYVVGAALSQQEQVILDPRHWDIRSKSYVDLKQLIKHEMSHSYSLTLVPHRQKSCYFSQSSKEPLFSYWLEEGLAVVASGQMESWKSRVQYDFIKYPHFYQILTEYGNYSVAGVAVTFLLGKFGKEAILQAITNMPIGYGTKDCYQKCDNLFFQKLGGNIAELEKEFKVFALKNYPEPIKKEKK